MEIEMNLESEVEMNIQMENEVGMGEEVERNAENESDTEVEMEENHSYAQRKHLKRSFCGRECTLVKRFRIGQTHFLKCNYMYPELIKHARENNSITYVNCNYSVFLNCEMLKLPEKDDSIEYEVVTKVQMEGTIDEVTGEVITERRHVRVKRKRTDEPEEELYDPLANRVPLLKKRYRDPEINNSIETARALRRVASSHENWELTRLAYASKYIHTPMAVALRGYADATRSRLDLSLTNNLISPMECQRLWNIQTDLTIAADVLPVITSEAPPMFLLHRELNLKKDAKRRVEKTTPRFIGCLDFWDTVIVILLILMRCYLELHYRKHEFILSLVSKQ